MNDVIFLHGLEVRCRIGIYDWEKRIKQKVLIDLEYPTDASRAARRDSVEDTLNYKDLAKFVIRFVSQSRFQLVETLAERLAAALLKEFLLSEIKVRISKPGAIRGAKNVGIEVLRRRGKR